MRAWYARFSFLLAPVVAIVLSGCNYSVRKQAMGGDNRETRLDTAAFVDSTLIQSSVLSSCKNCHSGQSQPYLDSMNAVRSSVNKVLAAVEGGSMPPARMGYAPLSECQKSVLRKWVELGTPDESTVKVGSLAACAGDAQPKPQVPISQEPLNYQTMLDRILKPKCLSCHNPDDDTDAAGILFYPYSELKSHTRMFKAPARQSKFVRTVTRTDDDRMPPPDSVYAPLTEEEVDFVIRWIDAGIPEQ